jgi:hypothetical protein
MSLGSLPSYLTGGPTRQTNFVAQGIGAEFLGGQFPLQDALSATQIAYGSDLAGNYNVGSMQQPQGRLFNQFADQQYGSIQRIAGGLNNQFTRDARGQVNRAMGAANQMDAMGNRAVAIGDGAGNQINALAPQVVRMGDQYMGQISGLGQMLGNQARQGFATSGPTGIEAELYRQGQRELAMGRSLSPEQLRDATQSARQGMAARGMATGNAALGAELLNRDRFASQREAERRQFAATANQMREQNVMSRRQAAGNMATASGNTLDQAGRMGLAGRELAGNLYDTAGRMQMSGRQIGGALLGDVGRLRLDGARATADLDPMQRALTPGLSLGQTAMGSSADMTQGAFGNMLDLFANTGSFNINRGDSLYNSWNNNVAGVKTGNLAANSQREAANITAAATRAARPKWWETGLGAVGKIFSDERMKTDIKPLGGKNVLGLTTYEYRYKGDKKKRKGYMAQEVAEVLPEAVEEVSHNGKKRLAIKPMVIGQALAQELAAQAA